MKTTVLCLFLVMSVSIFAAEPSNLLPEPPSPDEILPAGKSNDCEISNQLIRDACERAAKEQFEYNIESLKHRRDSLRWSLYASKVIFGIVIVLVVSGLVFAGIQFRFALSRPSGRRKNVGTPEEGGTTGNMSDMAANLEVSATGIRVNSSVLGVIILAISMAFFFMYARYVYPIRELPRVNPDITQGTNE